MQEMSPKPLMEQITEILNTVKSKCKSPEDYVPRAKYPTLSSENLAEVLEKNPDAREDLIEMAVQNSTLKVVRESVMRIAALLPHEEKILLSEGEVSNSACFSPS